MESKELLKAREYEQTEEKMIASDKRPRFHLSARIGWMNDPNGFSYYDGKYHLFYQYNPYDTKWGPMHWGHAVSKDLLHWAYLPAVLAPDREYDKVGCFSGSAVSLGNGRHLLMYTGVTKEEFSDPFSPDRQTQCLAIGDGADYEKYEKNPVIADTELPEGASRIDFRDPKMWKNDDGTYGCVVANRASDESGQILMFSSPDGFSWKYEQTLAQNRHRYGEMWECPDFFELDKRKVLIISPMDMDAKGMEYVPGNGTLCLIGDMDDEGKFVEQQDQAIDYGIEFYAPQTILAPDGRRIMIGWMQNWDTSSIRIENAKWYGQMSIPREVSIKNGRFVQQPIRELNQLHRNTLKYENVLVSGEKKIEAVSGRMIDMEMELQRNQPEKSYQRFAIRFAEDETHYSEIIYRPDEETMEMSRLHSGVCRSVAHQRKCKVKVVDDKIKLRLILDRYSAELFINDGEQTMTMTIYTDLSAEGIRFVTDGEVKMNVTKSDIVME